MKKVISLFLALILCLSLCACGGDDAHKDSNSSSEKSSLELGNEYFDKGEWLDAISYYASIPFNNPDHKVAQEKQKQAEDKYIAEILNSAAELVAENKHIEAVQLIDAARKTVSSGALVNAKNKYNEEYVVYIKTESDRLFNSEGVDPAVKFLEDALEVTPDIEDFEKLIKQYRQSTYTFLGKDIAPVSTIGDVKIGNEAVVDINAKTHGGEVSLSVALNGQGTFIFDLEGKYSKIGGTVLVPSTSKNAKGNASVRIMADSNYAKSYDIVNSAFETKSFEVNIKDARALKVIIANSGTAELPNAPCIVNLYVIK